MCRDCTAATELRISDGEEPSIISSITRACNISFVAGITCAKKKSPMRYPERDDPFHSWSYRSRDPCARAEVRTSFLSRAATMSSRSKLLAEAELLDEADAASLCSFLT